MGLLFFFCCIVSFMFLHIIVASLQELASVYIIIHDGDHH